MTVPESKWVAEAMLDASGPECHQGRAYSNTVKHRARQMRRHEWACMLAAAPAAAERKPDGWLPIETAPKDGGMFLGWVAAERWSSADGESSGHGHDTSAADFCWWRVVEGSPEGGYFDNASGQIGDSQGVTHWMPLPAAPAGSEGE